MGAYEHRYAALDLWAREGARLVARAPQGEVRLGHEITPPAALRESEFYRDFARHMGAFHMVGASFGVGSAGTATIGLHRPEGRETFAEPDRRAVRTLIDHLRRALLLRRTLLAGDAARGLAESALDALPTACVVVGPELQVVMANLAAERLIAASTAVRFRGGGAIASPLSMAAARVDDTRALAALVHGVALTGASGGAMRLWDSAGERPVAAMVSPLPSRLFSRRSLAPVVHGRALIVLRDLASPQRPPSALLRDVFGLTAAEAAIAEALVAGADPLDIARERGASVHTVRNQLRSALEKTRASNLRELVRILTALR